MNSGSDLVMDSVARPTKLRKLNHDQTGEDVVAALPKETAGQSAAESGVTPQVQHKQSEPTDLAANDIAVTGGQKSHETSEIVPSKANPDKSQPTPPLSKNQLKKQRKREEWEAGRAWRKARQKEKDAEKKARKRERKQQEEEDRLAQGLQPQSQRKVTPFRPTRLPVTFMIDCGFDDKMLEKERISLGAQVTRAYSDNNHARFQSHLVISSWGGLLKERFDTVMSKTYVNWRGVEFMEKDFVAAAETAKSNMTGSGGGKLAGVFAKYRASNPETQKDIEGQTRQDPQSAPAEQEVDEISIEALKQQGEVIYLTSDSDYTLTELKPYSTYIIGGLVDKNRYKGICYKTAREKGVKTAKLPIGQYMEMNSRYVLATNHVVELMVYWLECGDWGEAFMKAIPKRKGGKLKNGQDRVEPSGEDGDEAHDLDDSESDFDDAKVGDTPGYNNEPVPEEDPDQPSQTVVREDTPVQSHATLT